MQADELEFVFLRDNETVPCLGELYFQTFAELQRYGHRVEYNYETGITYLKVWDIAEYVGRTMSWSNYVLGPMHTFRRRVDRLHTSHAGIIPYSVLIFDTRLFPYANEKNDLFPDVLNAYFMYYNMSAIRFSWMSAVFLSVVKRTMT